MLSKQKQKVLLAGMCMLLILLSLTAIFIWPNFYVQYRMIKGVEIVDLTEDETEVIKNNIDFTLPESARMISAFTKLRPMEESVTLEFTIPKNQSEAFISSLSGYSEEVGSISDNPLQKADKEYTPTRWFTSNNYAFTFIYEYTQIDTDSTTYLLCYTDYPQAIGDIFYERIRIMPKWLDFH